MWISRRALAAAFGIAALAMVLALGAFNAAGSQHRNRAHHQRHHGRHHGRPLIKESLAPSQLNDPPFHGVSRGSAPWVLRRGEVRLKRDGKLNLRVRGLVIPNPPGDGTPGMVTTISASLYCGA